MFNCTRFFSSAYAAFSPVSAYTSFLEERDEEEGESQLFPPIPKRGNC